MKKALTLLLALAMALMSVPAFSREDAADRRTAFRYSIDICGELTVFEIDDVSIPFRNIDGETYVRLRSVAEVAGAQVAWDGANQAVIATLPGGDELTIVLAEIGALNDNGQVWAPIDEGVRVFFPSWGGIDRRLWYTDSDTPYALPVVRTTDHGQMATEFIAQITGNFYNRVPFSYRELEMAEWLIDLLLDMGHDEENIYMQTFRMDGFPPYRMPHFYDLFGAFDQERRYSAEAAKEAAVENFLMELVPIIMEDEGLTEEELLTDVADALGLPLEEVDMGAAQEFLRLFFSDELISGILYFFADYGLFDPDTIFRRYSQNVLLTIPGQSDKKIIVTAHKDSLLSPGANYNGSGVALLLESAYRLLNYGGNYYTIVFAFMGAGATNNIGTYYYLSHLTQEEQSNIVLNINAHRLIEGPRLVFGAAIRGTYQFGHNDTTRQVQAIAEMMNAEFGSALEERAWYASYVGDHIEFHRLGHGVVALTSSNIGAPPGGFILPLQVFPQDVYDCVDIINDFYPERIGDAFWVFSLFLERLLQMGTNG